MKDKTTTPILNYETPTPPLGAVLSPDGTTFRVWAWGRTTIELLLPERNEVYSLTNEGDGYFSTVLPDVAAGTRYWYRVDGGNPVPDPASRSQPDGVHAPSEVVDLAFAWTDTAWRGIPLHDMVIMEVHVGTATPDGTFDALIEKLPYYRDLGVTALEIMPVSQFAGSRNWGYDGVFPFAPAISYGGVQGLQRLVDTAHTQGLAILLDVVYNHLGPEGNYWRVFSETYFTDKHSTPWGDALNFGGPHGEGVRGFVLENALEWIHTYHIDGLRIDATHEIHDDSDTHILAELSARVHASHSPDRHVVLIAEDPRNDTHLITPRDSGGYGLEAVWADDFHHQVRRHLAGDHEAYYANYSGTMADTARTLRDGWWFAGQPLPVQGTPWGTPATDVTPSSLILCIQNHDQIGNRAFGNRLSAQVSQALYRAASALLLFSPYTPLLFMGQEWAASTPFQFFTDFEPDLGKLVTEGRRNEFKDFEAFSNPTNRDRIPDPQDPATFQRSKLVWEEVELPPHRGVLRLYRDMLQLRRTHPALKQATRTGFAVEALNDTSLAVRRTGPQGETLLLIVNFGDSLSLDLAEENGWTCHLITEARAYGGKPASVALSGSHLRFTAPCAVLLESTEPWHEPIVSGETAFPHRDTGSSETFK